MSTSSLQTMVAALLSFAFLVSIYRLGRIQKLSFRYTVGWMALGGLGVVAGLLIPFAESIAEELRVSPSALLGVSALLLLVTLCVQLSISISGLQEQLRRVTEEVAFLHHEIDEINNSLSAG